MDGINITFWQLLILMVASGLLPVIGMVLGAWFVFKTKHAQTGVPFIQNPLSRTADSDVSSYVGDMFGDEQPDFDEDEMSEAARRIRDQQPASPLDNLASIMGKK